MAKHRSFASLFVSANKFLSALTAMTLGTLFNIFVWLRLLFKRRQDRIDYLETWRLRLLWYYELVYFVFGSHFSTKAYYLKLYYLHRNEASLLESGSVVLKLYVASQSVNNMADREFSSLIRSVRYKLTFVFTYLMYYNVRSLLPFGKESQ